MGTVPFSSITWPEGSPLEAAVAERPTLLIFLRSFG
jgi:hypothetical protein